MASKHTVEKLAPGWADNLAPSKSNDKRTVYVPRVDGVLTETSPERFKQCSTPRDPTTPTT